MAPPLVSILINNFNYGRYLGEAIDSALAQSYRDVEVIVVDDGSTDDSREIIRGYGDRIGAILKENGGQASAFNAGFTASRGEIVIFLDADDYLFPDAVAKVCSVWSDGVAKVQYRLRSVDAEGAPLGYQPPLQRALDSEGALAKLLRKGRYGTPVTSGNAFGARFLKKILPAPEAKFRISADGYLVTLAPFFGRIVSIEEPLAAYRIHGSNRWSCKPNLLKERLQELLRHDLDKFELIRDAARERGERAAADPGLNDFIHLKARIASYRLNRGAHPYAADRAWRLIASGISSTVREGELSVAKRVKYLAWFLSVGLASKALSARLVEWEFLPGSRPFRSRGGR